MVKNLQFEDGKMIAAAQYFSAGTSAAVELTEEEKTFAGQMRVGLPLQLPARKITYQLMKCQLKTLFLRRWFGRAF